MSELEIKIGRRYIRRDGRVSGPTYREKNDDAIYADCDGSLARYWPDGRTSLIGQSMADLVAEYVEGDRGVDGPTSGEVKGPEMPAGEFVFVKTSEGRKDDSGKEPFDLIPPEFLFGTARVLGFGAKKYSARNWEAGMAWGRCFSAMMRHMWAWWGGKGPTTKNFLFGEIDAETGFSHLWHASACLAFLVAYEERGVGTDDRWKGKSNGC